MACVHISFLGQHFESPVKKVYIMYKLHYRYFVPQTNSTLKADFQSVLRTLESLFMFFDLLHVRHHKM